jgi:hypothetical protein
MTTLASTIGGTPLVLLGLSGVASDFVAPVMLNSASSRIDACLGSSHAKSEAFAREVAAFEIELRGNVSHLPDGRDSAYTTAVTEAVLRLVNERQTSRGHCIGISLNHRARCVVEIDTSGIACLSGRGRAASQT